MLEAQEMFRTANKVTRPEKALILGFMAGSRGMYLFRNSSGVILCTLIKIAFCVQIIHARNWAIL